MAENPRGVLFSGKIVSDEGVAINENTEFDIAFASGEVNFTENGTIEWGATHRIVESEEERMNSDYIGFEFSNGNSPEASMGIGDYTNAPSEWDASAWEFLLDPEYKNLNLESQWMWAEPNDSEEIATTAYFRRIFTIHPERHEEGEQDTFYLNWSIFPTGHFFSPVISDSFWLYLNGKLVTCGLGSDNYPNRENMHYGRMPFTVDDLVGDSTGVIAIKVESKIGPASHKYITSLIFAMGAAFTPNYAAPQFPYMPVDSLGNFWGVDLPFNCNGVVDELTWRLWLEHDVYTILDETKADIIRNKNIYLDASNNSEFNVDTQAGWFHAKLADYDINHTYETYSGGHTDQFYTRIRNMLIFHSDSF